jgi:hypothetical protein
MAAGGQKPSSNHRHKASSRFAQRQQRYAERWEQGSDTNTCTQNKDKWPTYCACFSEVRNFTTRLDKRRQHKTTGRIYTEHIPKRKIRIEFPDKILNFIYRCRRLVRFSCTALRVSSGCTCKTQNGKLIGPLTGTNAPRVQQMLTGTGTKSESAVNQIVGFDLHQFIISLRNILKYPWSVQIGQRSSSKDFYGVRYVRRGFCIFTEHYRWLFLVYDLSRAILI